MRQAPTKLINQQLTTVHLLEENDLKIEIDETSLLVRTNTQIQLNSNLAFLKLNTQGNTLVSALNTNAMITWIVGMLLRVAPTYFITQYTSLTTFQIYACDLVDGVWPAGLYLTPASFTNVDYRFWPKNRDGQGLTPIVTIEGFFVGCTVLDALLASTLDCLYYESCLSILKNYFPDLSQVVIH